MRADACVIVGYTKTLSFPQQNLYSGNVSVVNTSDQTKITALQERGEEIEHFSCRYILQRAATMMLSELEFIKEKKKKLVFKVSVVYAVCHVRFQLLRDSFDIDVIKKRTPWLLDDFFWQFISSLYSYFLILLSYDQPSVN